VPFLSDIEALLRATIGLDTERLGTLAIAQAVHRRMLTCRAPDETAYLDRLRNSGEELAALIDRVVVPETWFFRDRTPFEVLQQWALLWLSSGHPEPLQLLSIPCATGEEPYSMAMALLDVGFPTDRLQIYATDISETLLDQARAATYHNHSFRSGELGYRERYFHRIPTGFELRQEVRKLVVFFQGNLLDPSFGANRGRYHVIFCRNVLIYFDPAHQEQALLTIDRLLAPEGLLVVGHAETGRLVSGRFSPLGQGFAYRKNAAQKPPLSVASPGSAPPQKRRPSSRRVSCPNSSVPVRRDLEAIPVKSGGATQPPEVVLKSASSPADALAVAERLADQGRLEEAARICEVSLREQGPRAEAYYLLGLIRDACQDHAQAHVCFSRAVYLDPHHIEALSHLALAAARRGDTPAAITLRQRANRAALRQAK
jgi:chemotaxis protein methyltransferase WspC